MWQSDVAREPWAVVDGDRVTLHNVRNCVYRTAADYTPHWETRTVRLSQLTGIDLAINYWGSPWMAHPIVSFQFADGPALCFSIEVRKEVGESYSAVAGFFRQFELIYILAEERDVIRVRTNFLRGEEVYLYRTTVTPEQARQRFMEYLAALNELHDQPRWYNAATTNCTTSIRTQRAAARRAPWDWRILFNGKADELMFERGWLASGGLSFAELKARSLINAAAKVADDAPDFSRLIRIGLPGFENPQRSQSAAIAPSSTGFSHSPTGELVTDWFATGKHTCSPRAMALDGLSTISSKSRSASHALAGRRWYSRWLKFIRLRQQSQPTARHRVRDGRDERRACGTRISMPS